MNDIRVVIEGDFAGVRMMVDDLVEKLSPAGMAMYLTQIMDPFLRERARERFANEGDNAVGPWLALKDATQRIRESQGFGPSGPINRRTGALERYILGTPGSFASEGIASTLTFPGRPPSGAYLETKVLTAQEGKARPRTPRRPVLGVGATDMAFFQTSLSIYIAGGRPVTP